MFYKKIHPGRNKKINKKCVCVCIFHHAWRNAACDEEKNIDRERRQREIKG